MVGPLSLHDEEGVVLNFDAVSVVAVGVPSITGNFFWAIELIAEDELCAFD